MNKQSIGEMLRKIDARPDELTEYKGKWRNLYFLKSGETLLGALVFDTELEALKRALEWETEEGITFHRDECAKLGRIVFVSEWAYTIQLPVKS